MENTCERKSIKILHILQNKDKKFVLLDKLVEGLSRENFRQTLCYLHGERDGSSQLDKRFTILCLGSKSVRSFNPFVVFRVSKIIRCHGIDIVHCQRHKPTVYGALGSWLAGTDAKVVATVHGRNRTRNFGRKLANFFVFKRVSKIVAVSDAVRKDILKTNPRLKPDKVATIYNGIDEEAFSVESIDLENARKRIGIEEKEAVVFGTVGRLAPVKGHEFLLRAFSKVLDEIPGSWLVVAGSGPLESELKSRIEKTSMESRVRFLGFRSDIPQVLAGLDCFVLPSLSEGHPLSLLEAMACERPVIASAVGGIPEILTSPCPGILVEPRSPAQLASAMVKIGKMAGGKRAEIGKSLRNIVLEKYTSRKMISNTTELYRSLLATI